MEIGNASNHILAGTVERAGRKLDMCDLNPNICGAEAGCYSTGETTYLCICHDLKPADANNSCDRSEGSSFPSSSTESSATDSPLKIAPTIGSFDSHQLLGMLSTSKQIPNNITTENSNTTQSNVTSHMILQPDGSHPGPSPLVIACLLALALAVVTASLGLHRWRRRAKRRGRSAAVSLSRCMQQYIANPNYYSSSPENPLMRTLRELQIPPESVVLMEEVGEGAFGKVHKGLYTDGSGSTFPVAVKTLKENHNQDAQTEFEREVEIMCSFSHENILRLIGVVLKENETSPWMVFEFMQHGDLAQLLRSNTTVLRKSNTDPTVRLNQSDLLWISLQIANGMLYLSSQHFVHRDLATRNCLVGDNLSVKISDFGMSRDIYTSDYYKVGGSRMLPIRWMAPESITYGKFSLESDVWAYGVVLWEVFTFAKQPYYGHSNDEVVKLILQGILLLPPESCPSFICNIMAGCWKTEPRDRLQFQEICDTISPHTTSRAVIPSPDHSDSTRMDSDNYLIPTSVTVL